MNACIFAAGDPNAAEADFANHSRNRTVLRVDRYDVDATEFRRCDGLLDPLPPSFVTERAGGGRLRVIFVLYA